MFPYALGRAWLAFARPASVAGLFVFCLIYLAPAQGPQPREAPLLEPGKRIQSDIPPGTVHKYRLAAESGQYLHIIVDETASALRVSLLDRSGRKLRDWRPQGPAKPIEVTWIPDSNDVLLLQLAHRQKGASSATSYQILLDIPRPPTTRDSRKFSAMRIRDEAIELGNTDSVEAWQKAARECETSAAIYAEVGDAFEQADALGRAGGFHNMLGEVNEALADWNRSLELARSAGDRRGEGFGLHSTGTALLRLGEYEAALNAYSRALGIWRALRDPNGEANALGFLARAYSNLGDHRTALDYLGQMSSLLRTLGRTSAEFNMRFNIAEEHVLLGESEKALEVYTRYIEDCRTAGESCGGKLGEALALESAGRIASDMGDYSRALERLNAALAIYESSTMRRGKPMVLCQLGYVYARLGDSAKSLECLDKAVATMPAVPNRGDSALADFLEDAGQAYRLAGEAPKALDCFMRRLGETGAEASAGSRAKSLALAATAERDMGKLEEARRHIEDALRIIEQIRSRIANPGQRSTYFSRYRDYYDLYIRILMDLEREHPGGGLDAAAFDASEKSRARSLIDLLGEARVDIRQGVDPASLEQEKSLRRLINAAEQRRQTASQRKDGAEAAQLASQEVRRLSVEQDRLEAAIRASSPRYAGLTQPRPLTLREIQEQVLDDDTLLLEYTLGADCSYVWAVSKQGLASVALPKRAVIEASARQLYEVLSRRHRSAAAGHDAAYAGVELSRLVLQPVAHLLEGRRLLIVTDGMLQYVPFAALPDPNHQNLPLAAAHEVVHTPSASVLQLLRACEGGTDRKAVAVLADPVFEKDDPRVKSGSVRRTASPQRNDTAAGTYPKSLLRSVGIESGNDRISRLPFSRREAASILALCPKHEELEALDFRASRAAATAPELARYRIVHFATHAVLDGESPGLSGLVLSLVDERGNPQDGFLRLQDIFNLNLPADLVVLSACRTALGRDERGEGLIGLTRGFMYAGTARVVASLWKVDDAATAQLMTRFYDGMLRKKLPAAAALRAAQIGMSQTERWRDPFYWSAFILHGTWK